MRILYYIAYPHKLAGANRSLFELVTNLPAHVEPNVVLTAEGSVAEAYREAGVSVRILPPGVFLNQYGKAALDWSLFDLVRICLSEWVPNTLRLGRILRATEVDLVHTNDPRGTFLIGPAAKLLGLPLVAHHRGEIPFGGWRRALYERLPNHFISVSKATKRHLSPRARMHSTTVYNGTRDVSHRGAPVPWLQAHREDGYVVVGCFASVTPFKGYHHLLKAIARLNQRGMGNRAIFVGLGNLDVDQPAYVEWVRGLQQELGVENFTFAGWQNDPFPFYQSVDVTVLPSVSDEQIQVGGEVRHIRGNEGFPRTHLEAMCYGRPIVGTDIAGVREQVEDGTNGFVVPPSDDEALADALERLIEDADLRAQMGAAGRTRVKERFSTDAYVSGVVRIYEELAAGKRGERV